MISIAMILLFALGYLAIALEHPIKVDKSGSALFIGVGLWVLLIISGLGGEHGPQEALSHHFFDIASILFFLMGAMTIVEVVDAHHGFTIITNRIHTRSLVSLAWILGLVTFFMSAALDNLTTSIVMISLARKLIADQKTRWLFGGIIIIAANAGGAWSPIGDVTTTMLWIKGQLPDPVIFVRNLLLPSLVTILLPLGMLSYQFRGHKLDSMPTAADGPGGHTTGTAHNRERLLVFVLGIGGLLFIPFFKQLTHLPPFMGMMFSLSILWISTELLHRDKVAETREKVSVLHILRRIDTASILFFLGILLAVAALQEAGHLSSMAQILDANIGNIYTINVLIGLLSAVIDNVPLVAAAQGMYAIAPTGEFAASGSFWQFLAYCAGTGGSCLIIGSAAGVAVMGLEKIDFIWYLKKISLLALVGYLGGAGLFYMMHVL